MHSRCNKESCKRLAAGSDGVGAQGALATASEDHGVDGPVHDTSCQRRGPGSRSRDRVRFFRRSLTQGDRRSLVGMASFIVLLHVLGFGLLSRDRGAPALPAGRRPPGLHCRGRDPCVHLWSAACVRRRPHRRGRQSLLRPGRRPPTARPRRDPLAGPRDGPPSQWDLRSQPSGASARTAAPHPLTWGSDPQRSFVPHARRVRATSCQSDGRRLSLRVRGELGSGHSASGQRVNGWYPRDTHRSRQLRRREARRSG